MLFAQILTIFTGVVFVLYFSAIAIAIYYELKMKRLFSLKKQRLAMIDNMPISLAVRYAKRFKVEADYRRIVENIENKRIFVIHRILHMRKRSYGC